MPEISAYLWSLNLIFVCVSQSLLTLSATTLVYSSLPSLTIVSMAPRAWCCSYIVISYLVAGEGSREPNFGTQFSDYHTIRQRSMLATLDLLYTASTVR